MSKFGAKSLKIKPLAFSTRINYARGLFFLLFIPLFGEESPNVIVDLLNPVYVDGVLTTEDGGVLRAPDLRIQARKITYTKKIEATTSVFTVACEGDLLIDYQGWALAGDAFYYDFNTNKGFLTNGRTAAPPWYIGGKEFLLLENQDLVVIDGFITSSEGEICDVALQSSYILLTADRCIRAKNIHLIIGGLPVFWLPALELDLNFPESSPFAVRFGWGGFLGSYIGFLYRFISWRGFKATARLDGFFGKGVGFGVDTVFKPSHRPTRIYTRNYYAYDIPLDDPKRKNRYRFQGTYCDQLWADITASGVYDFVSDAEMASEYTTKDFDLKTAGKTQLEFHRQAPTWIASLFTRLRVNRFQSVNQELPTLYMHLHPLEIPSTGIIFENTFKASYLDYVFSEDVVEDHSFSSARIATHPFFYRPFFFGPFTLTPEAGFLGIAYSNSPKGDGSKGQALGTFGLKIQSAFSKCGEHFKHVIEPYTHYSYYTHPSVAPNKHYIFTIQDGWERLSLLRFGVRNSFFIKVPYGIERLLWIDLWANAFFDTHTLPQAIPKGYFNIECAPYAQIYITLDGAWNFQHKQIDFYNTRVEWTVNENFAFGIEYRHRGRYDWRKADFYNFILESTRPQKELLASALSDRRDTLLFRIFTRLTPNWSAKFDLRHGWHRKHQGPYLEYQLELNRIIFQHWKLAFNYEKRETDNRYSFSLLMEPGPP